MRIFDNLAYRKEIVFEPGNPPPWFQGWVDSDTRFILTFKSNGKKSRQPKAPIPTFFEAGGMTFEVNNANSPLRQTGKEIYELRLHTDSLKSLEQITYNERQWKVLHAVEELHHMLTGLYPDPKHPASRPEEISRLEP